MLIRAISVVLSLLPVNHLCGQDANSDAIEKISSIGDIRFVEVIAKDCLIGAIMTDSNAAKDEFPQHSAYYASPFLLSETEVTFAQFAKFANEAEYLTEKERLGRKNGIWRSDDVLEPLNTPVRFVTWNDAVSYTEWFSKKWSVVCRLPTEHEWEYACRGGTQTVHYLGDDLISLPLYCFLPNTKFVSSVPCSVKSMPPNQFGLYGMSCNVSEWCLDGYGAYPAERIAGQVARNSESRMKTVRGGNFYKDLQMARSSSREAMDATESQLWIGFRVLVESKSGKTP